MEQANHLIAAGPVASRSSNSPQDLVFLVLLSYPFDNWSCGDGDFELDNAIKFYLDRSTWFFHAMHLHELVLFFQ